MSTHTYIFTYIHIYIYIYTYIHIYIYIFTSHDGKHENTRLFLCSLSAKGTCGHTDNCTCPTCASLRRICLLVRTGLGHPCSPILPVLTFGNWRRDIFEHCCAKGAWYLPINLRLGRLTRKENLRKRRRPSLRSLCLRREGLLPPPSLRAHQLPKFPSFS